jgi:hypothetical protein
MQPPGCILVFWHKKMQTPASAARGRSVTVWHRPGWFFEDVKSDVAGTCEICALCLRCEQARQIARIKDGSFDQPFVNGREVSLFPAETLVFPVSTGRKLW